MRTLDIPILDERIRTQLPAYATQGSAGLDLRACIDEPLTLRPGDSALIPSGLAIHLGDPLLSLEGLTHALAGLRVKRAGSAWSKRARSLDVDAQRGLWSNTSRSESTPCQKSRRLDRRNMN